MSSGEFKARELSVDVPVDTGLEGFVAAIRSILRLPKVVRLEVDVRGKVKYTRYMRDEDPRKNIEVDFESIIPSAVVRNNEVVELLMADENNAAICVAALFHEVQQDHLYPIGWITGANTSLFEWHRRTTGVGLVGGRGYGLPIYRDRFVPDEALLLGAAMEPGGALVDLRKSYKITIPAWRTVEQTHRVFLPILGAGEGVPSELHEEHLVAAGVPQDTVDVLPDEMPLKLEKKA